MKRVKKRQGQKYFKICMVFALLLPMLSNIKTVNAIGVTDNEKIVRELIPLPLKYEVENGKFTLTAATQFVVKASTTQKTNELKRIAEYIAEGFRASTGYPLLVVTKNNPEKGDIVLTLKDDGSIKEEGYKITTTKDNTIIETCSFTGAFNAVQTLRQLLPADIEKSTVVNDVSWDMPCSVIEDQPEYGYRGMMLDVSRHFFTVDQVKRQLDMASQYKINKLHMHLSDDQGWRLEIKGDKYGESFDKLKTIGSTTSTSINGIKAGQYTQEEFKEIVKYAQDRYIEVIPEFDMPGHTWAALVSLNFLNSTADGKPHAGGYDNTKPYEGIDVGFSTFECRNEKTYEFVDEVFKQVSAISPSKYIHVGGDEAHSTSKEDYAYFCNRVTEIAKKYGKTPIGWQSYDEVVTDKENTVTQFWSLGNAQFQKDIKYVVSTADHAYMDMKYDPGSEYGLQWATFNPVDDSYNWDPTDHGSKDQVLGVEAALWTETIPNDYALDYMIYPRLPGHAEIAWTPKEKRNWDEYKVRLNAHGDRFSNQGIQYRRDSMIWYNPVNMRLPLDEGTGTTITDTKKAYTGTLKNGATWVDGKYGKGLHFDGTGYVDIGAPDLKDEWTIGMWVNREDSGVTNSTLISGNQGEIKLEQWKNTKKLGITKYGEVDATFNYEIPLKEWTHVTFVGDKSGTSLYVNGVYKERLNVSLNGPAKRLGANSADGLADKGCMKGTLDDVQIYNKKMTEEEIQKMMKDAFGFDDKLKWDLNEGEGTTISDSSGNYESVLKNTKWKDAKYGKGLYFNGEAYVDLGLRDIEGAWTIGMWVNREAATDNNAVLISGNEGEIKLEQYNNTKKVGITKFGVQDATFNYTVPENEWVHLTFTGDATGVTLYVNGESIEHINLSIKAPVSRIGANSKTGLASNGNLKGTLDDIQIYKSMLNEKEISIMMANKDKLQKLYEDAMGYDEKYLTTDTWNNLKIARDEAKVVLDDTEASYTMVSQSEEKLSTTIKAIQYKKADYSRLEEVKKDIPKDLSLYTKETVEHLNKVLKSIEMDLDIRKQNIVDGYVKDLKQAIVELKLIPTNQVDKSDLKIIIDACQAIDLNKYQKEGQEEFKEALANAIKVYEDKEATPKIVEEARERLLIAKYNLKEIVKDDSQGDQNDSGVVTGDNFPLSEMLFLLVGSLAIFTGCIYKKKENSI